MQKAKTYDILQSQILTQVSLIGASLSHVSEIMKCKMIIDEMLNGILLNTSGSLIAIDIDFLIFSENVSFQFSGEKVYSHFTFIFLTEIVFIHFDIRLVCA